MILMAPAIYLICSGFRLVGERSVWASGREHVLSLLRILFARFEWNIEVPPRVRQNICSQIDGGTIFPGPRGGYVVVRIGALDIMKDL